MKNNRIIALLVLLFAILMSLPWLVPGTGWLTLVGFVPLLCAERIATGCRMKRFWLWHYLAFVLWNAATTFWIWNATAGGAVFAILANAAQMSLIFGVFRFSRRVFKGVLPYVFLMVMWIAWERFYFSAEISWPWLTLGNAFAGTTRMVQWYSVTGTLGGSLWIWLVNLCIFGLMCSISEGGWWERGYKSQMAILAGVLLLVAVPPIASSVMYRHYEEKSESEVKTLIAQPNIDMYQKFGRMSQMEQNAALLELMKDAEEGTGLFIAPETFTSDVILNDVAGSGTWQSFVSFLKDFYPSSNLLFGASTKKYIEQRSAPLVPARMMGTWQDTCGVIHTSWELSYNSALVVDGSGNTEVCHKGKLVVGVEKTPYPRFFGKIDDMLGGVMGRCIPQKEASCLHLKDSTTFGCPICYESVYGEYCTDYVKKGAKFLAVITNDAWWGDTPGYRQHFNYSRLRAIELRRDIARCANTGISAFIDQRGDVVSCTEWWKKETLEGTVHTNSEITTFAKYGDIPGKGCTLAFLLLLLALLVRTVSGGFRRESA